MAGNVDTASLLRQYVQHEMRKCGLDPQRHPEVKDNLMRCVPRAVM